MDMSSKNAWIRCKFKVKHIEPIKWPPVGPYWVLSDTIIAAYVREKSQIKEFWPSAKNITTHMSNNLNFNKHFPQPSWWPLETLENNQTTHQRVPVRVPTNVAAMRRCLKCQELWKSPSSGRRICPKCSSGNNNTPLTRVEEQLVRTNLHD